MSTSWSARLVVGVPLKDVYQERIVPEERTKFDPDTGVPKKTTVSVLKRTFAGKPLPDTEPQKKERYDYYDKYPRDWDFLKPLGIDTQESYYNDGKGPNDNDLLGVVVGKSVYQDRWNAEIDMADLSATIAKVQTVIKNLGLDLEVKVYQQMTVG